MEGSSYLHKYIYIHHIHIKSLFSCNSETPWNPWDQSKLCFKSPFTKIVSPAGCVYFFQESYGVPTHSGEITALVSRESGLINLENGDNFDVHSLPLHSLLTALDPCFPILPRALTYMMVFQFSPKGPNTLSRGGVRKKNTGSTYSVKQTEQAVFANIWVHSLHLYSCCHYLVLFNIIILLLK